MKLFYLTHGDYNFSYELNKNFYETFLELGFEVIPFNYIASIRKYGRDKMNDLLLKKIKVTEPDIVFVVLFEEEIKKEVMKQISDSSTITMNWFCDDHWRFDSYTKYWAPLFHYSLTTAECALKKYKEINYDNVIYTQWAANPKYYKPYDVEREYEATFVGARYGTRPHIIKALKNQNINVECFGKGWPKNELIGTMSLSIFFFLSRMLRILRSKGRDIKFTRQDYIDFINSPFLRGRTLTAEEMIKMYSRSLINLNFSSASVNSDILQIKGRVFEVPMSGGLLFTDYIEELKHYFKFDEEIVVYKSIKELIEKIKYYLKNRDELERIRKNGYERSLKDHTYKKRFIDIFKQINVKI